MATIGYTGIALNAAESVSNWACEAQVGSAYRYTASSGDTVSEVAAYGSAATGGIMKVAIYVYSGGVPTTMVGSPVSIDMSGAAGWKTAPASISLTAGVEYVAAIDYYDDTAGVPVFMRYQNIGGTQMSALATPDHQNFRSPWAQGGTSDAIVSFYATVGVPTISLTVDNCSHTHTAEAPGLSISGQVNVANASHGLTSSVVALPYVDFTDDFNRANTSSGTANALGPSWNVPANSWYIDSNRATKVNGDHYVRWVEPMPSVDHFIEVDIPKDKVNNFMWFHLRAPNNTAGLVVPLSSYEAGINTTGGGAGPSECELGIVHAGGSYTVLGRATVTYGGVGATARLRLEAVGSAIKLYIDGILHISVTDTELTGTYVGLNCYAGLSGDIYYDNFRAGMVIPPAIDLTVANCTHAQTAEVPATYLFGTLTMADAVHGQTVSVPTLARVFSGAYPQRVAGRKWLDQNGNVYLMRTFSSWALAQNLTNAEITEALEGLAGAGFNSATVCIGGGIGGGEFGAGWHRDTNAAGQPFWPGAPWQLATPGTALGAGWSSVDWVMSEALRLGMTINLSIFYSWGTNGAASDINAATTTHMYNVGVAVATRYSAYPNIVWHVMFDDSTIAASPGGQRIDQYFHGINDTEGASTRLRWAEPNNGASIVSQLGGFVYFNLSANGWYSYAGNSTEIAETSWNETGGTTIPTGDVEPLYDGHSSTGQTLRYRTWATFLEGGSYANYGHEDWWPFKTPNPFGFTEGLVWQQVPDDIHTVQQSYIWPVIDAHCATPDWLPTSTWVLTGQGTGGDKAAIGTSANDAVAYFPSNSGRATVSVDTTQLQGTGNVRIRWFDPYANSYTTVAASEAPNASRSVTYPASAHADGATDYVLIVENVERTLAVDSAVHGHTVPSIALTALPTTLTISDAVHTHLVPVVGLTLVSTGLTVANALHGQLVDTPTLTNLPGTLTVANAVHGHSASSVAVATDGTGLAVDSAVHGHTASSILFSGGVQLRIGEVVPLAIYVGDVPAEQVYLGESRVM